MMMRLLSFFLLLATAFAVKEPRTGIDFPEKYKGSHLQKLGVRTKGPIKVYAVGQYDQTFLLKMYMGVGTEKMSGALSDALKPRCKEKEAIEDFESLMKKGCPNGVPKGTSLAFGTGGGKLSISVNDKNIGTVGSKPLSQAFAGIYTDKNAVCTLYPVGDGVESEGGGGGVAAFVTPRNCAAVAGAAIGYGLGKLFCS